MNKRINEFAINAELAELYDRYMNYCVKNADDDILDYDMVIGKFAELIALEAIGVCEQLRSSGENTDQWTITRDKAFWDCKLAIAEHFGVKIL